MLIGTIFSMLCFLAIPYTKAILSASFVTWLIFVSSSVRSSSDGIKTVIVLVLHRQQHNRQTLRAVRESKNQCRILRVTYRDVIKWRNSLNYTSFCSNRCLYFPTRKRRYSTQANHWIITGLNVRSAPEQCYYGQWILSHIPVDYRDVLRGRTGITGAEQEIGDRQHKKVTRLALKISVKSKSALK